MTPSIASTVFNDINQSPESALHRHDHRTSSLRLDCFSSSLKHCSEILTYRLARQRVSMSGRTGRDCMHAAARTQY